MARRTSTERVRRHRERQRRALVRVPVWLEPKVLERLMALGVLPDVMCDGGAAYGEPIGEYLDLKSAAELRNRVSPPRRHDAKMERPPDVAEAARRIEALLRVLAEAERRRTFFNLAGLDYMPALTDGKVF